MTDRREVLRALADGTPAAFATDQDDRIVFWNRGAVRLLDREPDEVLGRRAHRVFKERDLFVHGLRGMNVTLLMIPGRRSHLFTVVHILQALDEQALPSAAHQAASTSSSSRSFAPPVPLRLAVPDRPPLTCRERQILELISTGLQNKEVARELHISSVTVRNHVQNILAKLDVHSKLEAVSLAYRRSWVSSPMRAAAPSLPSGMALSAAIA
ncbi:MAG: LuxR C-terminal-related transcriptional regulator [Thermoanaerobaculia bacterium]